MNTFQENMADPQHHHFEIHNIFLKNFTYDSLREPSNYPSQILDKSKNPWQWPLLPLAMPLVASIVIENIR